MEESPSEEMSQMKTFVKEVPPCEERASSFQFSSVQNISMNPMAMTVSNDCSQVVADSENVARCEVAWKDVSSHEQNSKAVDSVITQNTINHSGDTKKEQKTMALDSIITSTQNTINHSGDAKKEQKSTALDSIITQNTINHSGDAKKEQKSMALDSIITQNTINHSSDTKKVEVKDGVRSKIPSDAVSLRLGNQDSAPGSSIKTDAALTDLHENKAEPSTQDKEEKSTKINDENKTMSGAVTDSSQPSTRKFKQTHGVEGSCDLADEPKESNGSSTAEDMADASVDRTESGVTEVDGDNASSTGTSFTGNEK